MFQVLKWNLEKLTVFGSGGAQLFRKDLQD